MTSTRPPPPATIPIVWDESFKLPLQSTPSPLVKRILKKFTYRFYNEKACRKCENLADRHCETCDSCAAFKGSKATAKIVAAEDNPLKQEVLSVPSGARSRLRAMLADFGVRAEVTRVRPDKTRHKRTIRVIKELRDYQEEAIDAIFKSKRGVIQAPPRSGKTVIATAAICEIGFKALILAHQRDWLVQFRETFLGSDTQEKFTNAREHQIGFARTLKDFDSYDVCLATFQQFMSKSGRAKLEAIRSKFPVIVVDEVHGTPALQSARVLSRFNSTYLIGLSGTPDRKMGDYVVAEDLVGPIIYNAKVQRLRPKVEVVNPPGKFELKGMGNAGYTYLISKLENNTPRREFLVREIIRRAEAGHMVLVPLTRVNAILNYVRDINAEMGPKYALPFVGGMRKEQRVSTIEAARRYKCKVIVGNISLLSTGLNIQRASCLFELGISSNLPKAEQRFARILTPMEGKPTPLVVFANADCDIMRACRRNEFWNVLEPTFNPIVSPEVKTELLAYFDGGNKRRRANIVDFNDIKNGI